MIELSLADAADILQGFLKGDDVTFTGVSNDTRTLQKNNLYIAINGENFDGHQFLAQAQQVGACAALVSEYVECDLPQVLVPDTTYAMGQLAKYWREQFDLPVVGITGSCGKTTTTRMVAAILSQAGKTLFPEGNRNNQFGVPQTLFKLDDSYEFAVIEMGANRAGDISYLSKIAQPDIAILTNVAPVHLDVTEGVGFGTLEGVFQEKSEIFRALGEDGVAIVNADDDYFSEWKRLLTEQVLLTYGFSDVADVRATDLSMNHDLQYRFCCRTPEGDVDVQLSSIGRHNIINALAATAAALALGISLTEIQQGLAVVPLVARRMNKHVLVNGAVIIDDTYNSNVKSAKAVIDMLTDFAGKKVVVLGDMAEIGEQSAEFHRQIGAYAKAAGIDQLFAFGTEAIAIQQGFGDNAEHYYDIDKLVNALQPHLRADSMTVIKGSNSVGMNRIVNALVA